MANEPLIATPRANQIERRGVLGRRISVVLNVGDRGLNLLNVDLVLGIGIARLHMTILAGLCVRARLEVCLKLAVEPLEISHLLQRMPERFLIHYRQVDRVTTAAQSRVLDVLVVLRLDSKRTLHRMRRDVFILERSEYLARFAGGELACDVVLQERLKG